MDILGRMVKDYIIANSHVNDIEVNWHHIDDAEQHNAVIKLTITATSKENLINALKNGLHIWNAENVKISVHHGNSSGDERVGAEVQISSY